MSVAFCSENSLTPTSNFFCDDAGSNNGTRFRITASGRLTKIKNSGSEDTHFHGSLHFSPAIYGNYENKYVARFSRGRLQSIEKIKDGSEPNEDFSAGSD